MLAAKYRIAVVNQSGGSVTQCSVRTTAWKFDVTGALEYDTSVTELTGSIADTATAFTAEVTNTAKLMLGLHGQATFTGGGSGSCYVYFQQSDDGTNWADVLSNPIATATNPAGKVVEFEV